MLDKPYYIFDMDGTLLDSMQAWHCAGAKYAESLGLNLPDEIIEQFAKMPLAEALNVIQEYANVKVSTEDFAKVLLDLYYATAKPKSGVVDFLQCSRLLGKHMCIITATPNEAAIAVLKHFDLFEYFDFVLTPDVCASGKDRPDVFFQALNKFGCNVNDAVFFEDALYSIKTATDMGLFTVAVAEEYYEFQKDEIIKTADCYLHNGFSDMKG